MIQSWASQEFHSAVFLLSSAPPPATTHSPYKHHITVVEMYTVHSTSHRHWYIYIRTSLRVHAVDLGPKVLQNTILVAGTTGAFVLHTYVFVLKSVFLPAVSLMSCVPTYDVYTRNMDGSFSLYTWSAAELGVCCFLGICVGNRSLGKQRLLSHIHLLSPCPPPSPLAQCATGSV